MYIYIYIHYIYIYIHTYVHMYIHPEGLRARPTPDVPDLGDSKSTVRGCCLDIPPFEDSRNN